MAEEDIFAFLNTPALSAAAVPETSPLVNDEFDTLLKEAFQWPEGFPKERKSHEHVTRFHYRQTNESQAKTEFHSILIVWHCVLHGLMHYGCGLSRLWTKFFLKFAMSAANK